MAKLNLLEIVQDIANDLETDAINSINDTVESLQIAQIVKTSFFEIISHRNWPHLKRTMQVGSSGTASRPTHMRLDDGVTEICSLYYNKKKSTDTRDKYEALVWKDPEDFIHYVNQRNSSLASSTVVQELGGIDLIIKNDTAPTYFTSFDDEYIVCDAYDSTVDSTLQNSKTQMTVYETPSWTTSDTFIPDLPESAFPALIEEAKSTAFVVLKQQANEKAEQKATRQQRWLSRKAWRVNGGVQYPDYGRKTVSARSNGPRFTKD